MESKKQRISESVQSLVDERREKRKKTQLTGSSHPISPIMTPQNEICKGNPPEDPVLINSPLAPEILGTPNPAKIKISNMAAFDETLCLEEHLMAYKNLMLLYTADPAL